MSANTNGLKPIVRRLMQQFLDESKKQGILLLVTQGLRTIEEQNELYKKGRRGIKEEKIVTNAKGGSSWHNAGCAFDVCGFDGKKVNYDIDWNKLEKIGNKIGLEHGDCGYKDLPHWQVRLGYSIKDFQSNKIDWKKFA